MFVSSCQKNQCSGNYHGHQRSNSSHPEKSWLLLGLQIIVICHSLVMETCPKLLLLTYHSRNYHRVEVWSHAEYAQGTVK